MLILTRSPGESFRIGDDITVTVVESSRSRVAIAIDAPRSVPVMRNELGEYRKGAHHDRRANPGRAPK